MECSEMTIYPLNPKNEGSDFQCCFGFRGSLSAFEMTVKLIRVDRQFRDDNWVLRDDSEVEMTYKLIQNNHSTK